MKLLTTLMIASMLTGCATIQSWVPSFWDDNQSDYIISARLNVERINCSERQQNQVQVLAEDLRKFELYSEAKGTLQKDVLRVLAPMQATVKEWQARGEGGKMYCELKKRVLTQQADRASKVILGRW